MLYDNSGMKTWGKIQRDLVFNINRKSSISSLLGYDTSVPKGELFVRRGTIYSGSIDEILDLSSLALVAKAKKPGMPDYLIGFMKNWEVGYYDNLKKPLMLGHKMLLREKEEFRNDTNYSGYQLHLLGGTTLSEFLRGRNIRGP